VLAECAVDFFSSPVRQDAQQASDFSFSPFVSPLCVGRDSSVGIAIHYGLDGRGRIPVVNEILYTRPYNGG